MVHMGNRACGVMGIRGYVAMGYSRYGYRQYGPHRQWGTRVWGTLDLCIMKEDTYIGYMSDVPLDP